MDHGCCNQPLHCLFQCLSYREKEHFTCVEKLVIVCRRTKILLLSYPTISAMRRAMRQACYEARYKTHYETHYEAHYEARYKERLKKIKDALKIESQHCFI
jgi:hypothetical protein